MILYNNNSNNNKAFSLIELSIVLIIMGLLVAGVMGGSSLIWSAKIRSTVQEYYEYKTAYNAYYARYGHVPNENPNLPGTVNGYKSIMDLYENGLINKEPIKGSDTEYFIYSRIGYKVIWDLNYLQRTDQANSISSNVLEIGRYLASARSNRMKYKDAVSIESKIDDGKADSGNVYAYAQDYGWFTFGNDGPKTGIMLFFKMDF